MKFKFFAIPARHSEAAEAELNAFCIKHRISYIDKHLVADGVDSFWSICISWLDGEAAPSALAENRSKPSVDYKQILSEADFGLYLELRNYRKEQADHQNVPPYALFTNEQLASMVQQRVSTKTALQLQSCYAAVHAILQGTDSKAWRQHNLRLHPAISV